MKTKIVSLAIMALGLWGATTSCSDNWTDNLANDVAGTLNIGTLQASVDAGEEGKEDTGALKKTSSRAVISLSDYIVEVIAADGQTVKSWTYSKLPPVETFTPGTYTVRVKSHTLADAEWDKPYYVGEQQFQIQANKVTDVDPIVCRRGNVRVSVFYTNDLLNASNNGTDLKITITSTPGTSLEFSPAETRSGYFAVSDDLKTLKVHFTGTVNGMTEDFTKTLTDLKPGQHRKITFGLYVNTNTPEDEKGNINISDDEGINVDMGVDNVDLDGTVTTIEDIQDNSGHPGSDEEPDTPDTPDNPDTPENPDDPTDDINKIIGFTAQEGGLDLNGVNDADQFGEGLKPAVVYIHSENGVKNLNVEIVSDFLTEDFLASVGLTTKFDLANPGSYAVGLAGLGFPTAAEVNGAHDLTFDITQFMPLILESGNHNFKISVNDLKDLSNGMTLRIVKY